MALASISFVSCKEKKQSTTTSKKDSEPVVFKTATVPELTDFSYTLTDSGEGVLITKYLGTSDSVRIPSEIEGIPCDFVCNDRRNQRTEDYFRSRYAR